MRIWTEMENTPSAHVHFILHHVCDWVIIIIIIIITISYTFALLPHYERVSFTCVAFIISCSRGDWPCIL